MAKKRKMERSWFMCTKCGKEGIALPRKTCKQREPGHLKKLYCIYCREETNHAEIKENGSKYTMDDFLTEFRLGRFVNGERVPISQLQSCKRIECEYNRDGKCWNVRKTKKEEE